MVTFVREPQSQQKRKKGTEFWINAFPSQKESFWSLSVLGITLIGLLFRLVYIQQPVGFDEAYTYLAFSTHPLIHIFTDYSYPNNHIFHTFLVSLVSQVIPLKAIWVMRLPALIAGVCLIPATYLAGRSLYSTPVGVVASALVAASPLFINFSAEARGYTILCLMTVLMLWLAGQLKKQSHWSGWLTFSICGILGALTIPIMLYPLAAIYIWLVVDTQLTNETSESTQSKISPILFSAGLVLVGTIVGYLPVVLYGTGYNSLVGNSFVSGQPWDIFFPNFIDRLKATWESWNANTSPILGAWMTAGFFLSLVFHSRLSNNRLHLAIPTILSILAIVLFQQVAPMPRIWQFLQAWFYIWVGAGWVGLFSWFKPKRSHYILPVFIFIFVGFTLIDRTNVIYHSDFDIVTQPGVEQSVAWILSDQVQEDELIATVIPSSTQIKYYFNQSHDYQDWFYDKGNPKSFQKVLVVVNTKYDETLETVLERNELLDRVNLPEAVQIAAYKKVNIYRIPILEIP